MTETERKEKMNELMNKISFALKDATLAQGFEIICKRISELENDRKNLLEKIKAIKEVLNIEEIYRLKKENAELKAKLCLMRKWIYGNFDLENKIEQLKFIDGFGKELSE